jgi:hypothetical protein
MAPCGRFLLVRELIAGVDVGMRGDDHAIAADDNRQSAARGWEHAMIHRKHAYREQYTSFDDDN